MGKDELDDHGCAVYVQVDDGQAVLVGDYCEPGYSPDEPFDRKKCAYRAKFHVKEKPNGGPTAAPPVAGNVIIVGCHLRRPGPESTPGP